jgi:hypothetical protein
VQASTLSSFPEIKPQTSGHLMELTPSQLREQLACLHCGIAWEGTPKQQIASTSTYLTSPQFIEQQLSALSPADAKQQRRRFRKLWRAHALRAFGPDFDMGSVASSVKRAFAMREALYRFNRDTGL